MRSFQLLSISAELQSVLRDRARLTHRMWRKTRVKFLDQSTLLSSPPHLSPLLWPSAAAVTPLPAVPDHTQWEDCGIAVWIWFTFAHHLQVAPNWFSQTRLTCRTFLLPSPLPPSFSVSLSLSLFTLSFGLPSWGVCVGRLFWACCVLRNTSKCRRKRWKSNSNNNLAAAT